MLEQNMFLADCRVENTSGSLFDSLIDILRKELSIYQELKDFIIKEKKLLIRASVQELNVSNAAKENIILKARIVGEVRTNILKKIASNLDIEEDEIKLGTLANFAVIEQRQEIVKLRKELESISREINLLNEVNKNLLDVSLNGVKGAVDFINSLFTQGPVYLENGKMKTRQSNSKFVHTEG